MVYVIYLVAFVVLTLGVARWTRVVSKDDITAFIQRAVDRRFGENSKISQLIWCVWCSGWWMAWFWSAYALGFLWVLGVMPTLGFATLPLLAPAVAYAASWILDKEE